MFNCAHVNLTLIWQAMKRTHLQSWQDKATFVEKPIRCPTRASLVLPPCVKL